MNRAVRIVNAVNDANGRIFDTAIGQNDEGTFLVKVRSVRMPRSGEPSYFARLVGGNDIQMSLDRAVLKSHKEYQPNIVTHCYCRIHHFPVS